MTLSAETQRRRLVIAGLVGFLLLGLVAAVLGPALPEFRSRFHLSVSQGSLLLTVYSVGSVVGVLASGWASHLRRPRPAMVVGTAVSPPARSGWPSPVPGGWCW